MSTVAVIQARHTSTRLPGKMLLALADIPVIEHIVRRVRAVASIDRVCISIPVGDSQAPLADFITTLEGVHLSRGPEEDLLTRFAIAAEETGADVIVRLWGDCPAIDPALISVMLDSFTRSKADWAYLNDQSGYPLGNECQAISRKALGIAAAEATSDVDLEAVHSYLDRIPARFSKCSVVRPGSAGQSKLQMLLDTADDYRKLGTIFDTLYPANPLFGLAETEALAAREPELFRPGNQNEL
ncbi:MAG: NTP transferase domain-containing protein [Rhodospirillales bacterium]